MNCQRCGSTNSSDSKFCKHCGNSLPVIKTSPEMAQRRKVRLTEGMEYLRESRFNDAIEAAADILSAEPDNMPALNLKAMAYEKIGDFARAIEILEKIIEINPDSVQERMKIEALKANKPSITVENPLPAPKPKTNKQANANLNKILVPIGITVFLFIVIIVLAVVFVLKPFDNKNQQLANANTNQSAQYLMNSYPNNQNQQNNPNAQQYPMMPTTNTPSSALTNPGSTLPSGLSGNSIPLGNIGPVTVGPINNVPPSNSNPASSDNVMENNDNTEENSVQNTPQDKPVYDISVNPEAGSNNSTEPPVVERAKAYLQIAGEKQIAGDFQGAVKAYLEALNLLPNNPMIQQNIAACYERLGDNSNAIRYYQLALNGYQLMIENNYNPQEAKEGADTCRLKLQKLGA